VHHWITTKPQITDRPMMMMDRRAHVAGEDALKRGQTRIWRAKEVNLICE
jgi:hypothetical protein